MTQRAEQEAAVHDPLRAAQAELEILRMERTQLPDQYRAALAEAHAEDMIALRRQAEELDERIKAAAVAVALAAVAQQEAAVAAAEADLQRAAAVHPQPVDIQGLRPAHMRGALESNQAFVDNRRRTALHERHEAQQHLAQARARVQALVAAPVPF